jgi:hypothetical protein
VVGQRRGTDQPAGGRRRADDPAAPPGGGQLAGERAQRVQPRAVPEADGRQVDHDLAGTQPRRLVERLGDQRQCGEIRVAGEPDDDLVGGGDDSGVEQGHGASGIGERQAALRGDPVPTVCGSPTDPQRSAVDRFR